MRSKAEEYRRRGIEAQQGAARATDLSIKQTFTDIAHGGFALADQAAPKPFSSRARRPRHFDLRIGAT